MRDVYWGRWEVTSLLTFQQGRQHFQVVALPRQTHRLRRTAETSLILLLREKGEVGESGFSLDFAGRRLSFEFFFFFFMWSVLTQ